MVRHRELGVVMPQTSIRIDGNGSPLRAGRRNAGLMVGLLGEMIGVHARHAGLFPGLLRTRLIECGSEGERGPPVRDETV